MSGILFQKVVVEGCLIDQICNAGDDEVVCEIVRDGELGDKYVVTIVRLRSNKSDTDSASSGRSQSSRINTSTKTLRSLL